ncbi:hypothetical protein HUT18_18425 [Streptomyces sp. NA04227]|uniref:hypothetical protein n=1 Tax=Streptomyces sp. NA04227 TaxID=2742136 RepID=UPI001590F034|nr:hypothetical protein [Streptomyces sp. NA04227]QKW08063.1 hypothetical protein HUT18_18425 [Streptomyces sp. NA04227]
MNRRQIAALLNYAATLDSRVRRSLVDEHQAARTIDEWAAALSHVPATLADGSWDATTAVRRYYEQHRGDRTARYFAIEPHHLLAVWAEHRHALMNRHTDPVPAADPDDVAAYRAELADTRAAVATGQTSPALYRAALNNARAQRVAELVAGVAEARVYVPADAAQQLAAAGLGAQRERFPELAVACPVPTCRAAARHRCKTPSGRELREHTHDARQQFYARITDDNGGAAA